MSNFARRIRPPVAEELRRAAEAEARGEPQAAFRHLERAHVLGQASTREHVRAHVHMLGWGFRRRSGREVLGQLFRIVGASALTVFGLVPAGNTGGSNVSPFKPLPLPTDLEAIILEATTREST